jgi:NAD(P)-dependent dehydrogenase (short-subunit alcohol dehydrogenase family)
MDSTRQPVAVVVGATSKWQADGRNTKLAHGRVIDDSDLPVGVRWGVGGAIAQKFAQEGFMVVLTTRQAANAAALEQAIHAQGGAGMIVELDLVSQASISKAFTTVRDTVGDPDVVIYNAGYLEGRDLPPEKELLEHFPVDMFDTAMHISCRARSWSPKRYCRPCASAVPARSSFRIAQFIAVCRRAKMVAMGTRRPRRGSRLCRRWALQWREDG